ncbi:Transcriptional regulator LytR [bioreactor metagenome]|uniref:Transcriptional regulator LytR n=1 Tax=bioreactor metagenome TaxID=1076179 RepID=A0A644W6W3_9ZZZZ
MQELRQREKAPKRLRWLRRAYHVLVVLSLIIVVTFCGFKLIVRAPAQKPVTTPEITENQAADNPSSPTPVPLVRKEQFYTFLLAASDQSSGNADTIMVVSYDVKNQTVGVVSVPRDTLIDRDYPKINNTYASGGVSELSKAVSNLVGFPLDYYITVDIKAFKALVDAVGGVDFDVPIDMDYDDPTQDLHIHYKAGVQPLDGQQALEVVRFRKNNDGTGYSDSDIGRTHTQQKLLTAIAKKVASWSGLSKFNKFVDIFSRYVKTDLSATDITYFASQAVKVDLDHDLGTATLPCSSGSVNYHGISWCYQLDKEKSLAIINELLNPYTTEITDEIADIYQVE